MRNNNCCKQIICFFYIFLYSCISSENWKQEKGHKNRVFIISPLSAKLIFQGQVQGHLQGQSHNLGQGHLQGHGQGLCASVC